jgi:S1-C subfamily serine protease
MTTLLALVASFAISLANHTLPVVNRSERVVATATLLTPNWALTAAHAVADQGAVAFLRCGTLLTPAVVARKKAEVDLALIQLVFPCEAVKSLELADVEPDEGEAFLVQGYPAGGPRRTLSATVSSYDELAPTDGFPTRKVMLFDGHIIGGNSGGPGVYKGKLIGIVSGYFTYIVGTQTMTYGILIPLSVVRAFLTES